MTWNPRQKRWLKKYRGKMYSVSPHQLQGPPTKDGSRQAANQWWEAKKRELDDKQAGANATLSMSGKPTSKPFIGMSYTPNGNGNLGPWRQPSTRTK